jgi:hypothetical protein
MSPDLPVGGVASAIHHITMPERPAAGKPGGEGVRMNDAHGQGPKFTVNIDDTDYLWDRDTITVSEIRSLAGIPAGTEVLEIDLKTNDERTLAEGEVVTLKPGHGFGKKIKFKRG